MMFDEVDEDSLKNPFKQLTVGQTGDGILRAARDMLVILEHSWIVVACSHLADALW